MEITGFVKNDDLFRLYADTWDSTNDRYSSASGRLNTKFKLQRDSTYDYILISIYNWLIEDHNCHFANVDEGIKGVEIKFSDAVPDSNGRIIDSMTMVNYIDKVGMHNN